MPYLIDRIRILDEQGYFKKAMCVAFDETGILYCGQTRPDLRKLHPLHSENDWQEIAGGDSWLMPGMIDAHCHLGLFNDGLTLEGEDGNEDTDPVTPQLQAVDGVYHEDRCFGEAVSAGITAVMTGPGSTNILAGRFALMQTNGNSADQMLIRRHAAMKAALGENPKRSHGQGKDRSPVTRMASAAILRDALIRADWYRRQKQTRPRELEPDLRWEALLPALSGELLFKFHVHRADDILTAIRIADEFGLRYTLDHCTEGYRIADLLRQTWERGQADILSGRGRAGHGRLEGIITGPLLTDRSKPELRQSEPNNPALLAQTGMPIAIMTDHPVIPIQYLAISAMVAMKAGLPEHLALKAITSSAADLSGAGDQLGRVKAGCQADLVLLNGHPFDYRSKVTQVWIKGQPVGPAV